jgi:hypothetical protein
MTWTTTQLDDLKEVLKLLKAHGADINENAVERAIDKYKQLHGL